MKDHPDTASTDHLAFSDPDRNGSTSTRRTPAERIIRKAELLEITGVSIATLYRWISNGRFPAPVQLGPNSVGWRWSEVQAWLESLEPASGVVAPGGQRLDGQTRERR